MASLPVRRSGRNQTLMNPTREFEDIYDRMGQLMNFAFGGLTPVALADMPWAPVSACSGSSVRRREHAAHPFGEAAVFHGVKIADSALVTAVTLSHRYIPDRFLPDKAIDLVDEACAMIRIGYADGELTVSYENQD